MAVTYKTIDDWLGETEAFSLRLERLPDGALPWVQEAWRLGYEAGLNAQPSSDDTKSS